MMNGHDLYYVEAFQIVGPYTLRIVFDDSSEQTIDFEPILRGKLLEPLQDLSFFNQVYLDPEIRNLVWPNDAAFDPETLRNWPRYRDEFIAKVQKWERVPA
jgi:hypothetical protein